jgi:2-dehydropantoate 2-reductase
MKIMIMGSGGVGAYYGGLLAKQGHTVTFIARGAHLEAMKSNGLEVKSIHGDFEVKPVQVTDRPAEAGVMDLILFCVKTYDTDEAVEALRPALGPRTAIISLQNGVDAAERIGNALGLQHVLGGVTYLSSAVEAPGVIKQVSQFRRIVFGELDGSPSERVRLIHEALEPTGIAVETTEAIQKVLWTKFVFISAASGLGSLTRLPIGDYRSIPETRATIAALMREVQAVSNAQGIQLDGDVVGNSLKFMDGAAPQIKASMQLDVEAGRRTELESMIGVIGRRGRQVGVPTPVADFIYASLLPLEQKARRSTPSPA